MDEVLLAGRPIRPEEYEPGRWAIWSAAVKNGTPIPPIYPGHVTANCETCGIEIQVGPRQQAAIQNFGSDVKVKYMCLIDATIDAATQSQGGADVSLHNLGNPHTDKD